MKSEPVPTDETKFTNEQYWAVSLSDKVSPIRKQKGDFTMMRNLFLGASLPCSVQKDIEWVSVLEAKKGGTREETG